MPCLAALLLALCLQHRHSLGPDAERGPQERSDLALKLLLRHRLRLYSLRNLGYQKHVCFLRLVSRVFSPPQFKNTQVSRGCILQLAGRRSVPGSQDLMACGIAGHAPGALTLRFTVDRRLEPPHPAIPEACTPSAQVSCNHQGRSAGTGDQRLTGDLVAGARRVRLSP